MFEIIWDEKTQELLDKFQKILGDYEIELRNVLRVKYAYLSTQYPQGARYKEWEDYESDPGRKIIQNQIKKIMNISIPENIVWSWDE